MTDSKKEINELEAATLFVSRTTIKAQELWPKIYKSFRDMFKEKFAVENETMAIFDLSLAAIAQDLQAVKNLFQKEQAERIEKWVLKCIDTKEYGEYAKEEVKKYSEAWQQSHGREFLDAIPTRLLHRWLGKNLQNFLVKINGKQTDIISPFLVGTTTGTLLNSFAGVWKTIKDTYDLVEADLPFDENAHGLKDYIPEVVENKPDGTIRYYDENGNLKEKWLSPEQIDELLKKGEAKRLYKVLIKGPWDGIKEALWELSDQNVEKFVDEKDYAYASCSYKKGKPKYILMERKMWKKMDEMEAIIMNPNLSEKQRVAEIKKITGD